MSGWDADRVRIELCAVMAMTVEDGEARMRSRQGAEIWLSDDEGKVRRRKPDLTLVDDDRPGLLRQLADWIEARIDPSLELLVEETAAARKAGAS